MAKEIERLRAALVLNYQWCMTGPLSEHYVGSPACEAMIGALEDVLTAVDLDRLEQGKS